MNRTSIQLLSLYWLLTLSSCNSQISKKEPLQKETFSSQADLSSTEIIRKSIAFHDPNAQWKSLCAKFFFNSSFHFNDSVPEELEITIDVSKNTLRYHNLDRKVDFQFSPNSCANLLTKDDCNSYKWTHNFYTYIWGLPMKLSDPGVTPLDSVKTTSLNDTPCYQIEIAYADETYQFYFSQENFELLAFEFLKNDDSGKGEYIELEGLYEYNSIKFPAKRTWMHLHDMSLIGVNQVDSITEVF